jgi:hypothetical protein
MWFKLFVLVRIPISLVCLSGWAMLLQGSGAVFSLMALGMLALLVFVSIRLFKFHEDALGLAVSLLLLEMVGVVPVMAMVNYSGSNGALNLLTAAVIVGLVWILPNALVLYSQRAKFTEPAKEKPVL